MATIMHLLKYCNLVLCMSVQNENDLIMKYNRFCTIWASEEGNKPLEEEAKG